MNFSKHRTTILPKRLPIFPPLPNPPSPLTVLSAPPAADFPDLLSRDPDEFQDDEGRGQAGLLLVLLDQAEHLVLPDLHAVLADLLEHVPAPGRDDEGLSM